MKMKYRNIPFLDEKEILDFIKSGKKRKIVIALLSLFSYEVNKELAIEYAKWAIESLDVEIKKSGILGMGYIVRVYGLEDVNIFKENIEKIENSNDAELIGILNDVKDDFNSYIPYNIKKNIFLKNKSFC